MATGSKIYTKTGDLGETSLLGGTRVPKYHERVEAYGTLDELKSFIGFLHDQAGDAETGKVLVEIIKLLFSAESMLATDPSVKITRPLPSLSEKDVEMLEKEIDRMNSTLPELSNFILPAGHPNVSLAHICRSVCRRSERMVIKLSVTEKVDETIIRFLNRLSDYLFVLSRYLAHEKGIPDFPWKVNERYPCG